MSDFHALRTELIRELHAQLAEYGTLLSGLRKAPDRLVDEKVRKFFEPYFVQPQMTLLQQHLKDLEALGEVQVTTAAHKQTLVRVLLFLHVDGALHRFKKKVLTLASTRANGRRFVPANWDLMTMFYDRLVPILEAPRDRGPREVIERIDEFREEVRNDAALQGCEAELTLDAGFRKQLEDLLRHAPEATP